MELKLTHQILIFKALLTSAGHFFSTIFAWPLTRVFRFSNFRLKKEKHDNYIKSYRAGHCGL